eukprot:1750877-Lingulodinium_polyedra.AAC.1
MPVALDRGLTCDKCGDPCTISNTQQLGTNAKTRVENVCVQVARGHRSRLRGDKAYKAWWGGLDKGEQTKWFKRQKD